MSMVKEGVYWCARDLAGLAIVGNHHFILLVTSKENFQPLSFASKSENGILFCTLNGFLDDDGRLVLRANNGHDVKATREYIDPDEDTSPFLPDLDLELHWVRPPQGPQMEFIWHVARLARNYQRKTADRALK